MKYKKTFVKQVWGYALVEAANKEEAAKKFDEHELEDEFDNESQYEWDKEITPANE